MSFEEIAGIAYSPPVLIIGFDGKNSFKCLTTPIGPIPGPPPPCGIANVLCKFK